MANMKYWLWLSQRKGLGGGVLGRVLERFGSPEGVFFAAPEEFRQIEGMTQAGVQSLEDKCMDEVEATFRRCDRLGIRLITLQDARYPERLSAIYQPPLVLYCKGREIPFDDQVVIGVVGTRRATEYGCRVARTLSRALTRQGAVVVSGLAQGVDASAVYGALREGGPVVSVLACGLDVVYPRENRRLYEAVAQQGLLISEYPPGTAPLGTHFPVRNRIISGLSVGVVAVESPRHGGTLHTVNHALEQGREVFAVPGPWDSPYSEGTNRLIQEGAAKLILGAEDVLCEFRDQFPGALAPPKRRLPHWEGQRERQSRGGQCASRRAVRAVPAPSGTSHEKIGKEVDIPEELAYIDWKECSSTLTDDQRTVLLALRDTLLRVDDLVEHTQMEARRILAALTILQIQGYVAEESGKRFRAAVRWKME